MKTVLLLLVLITASGCRLGAREDEGPVKVHRPEAPQSEGYAAGPRGARNIPVEGEEVGRLVGNWPEKAEFLDLDEQKVPVREILERFARISKLNFIIADEVGGQVTTRMERVRWTRALQAVLEAKDLVAVREGNVVRILRREDWYAEMHKG